MPKPNKVLLVFFVIALAAAAVFLQQKMKRPQSAAETTQEIKPAIGAIQNIISTTGTVLPRNRLEVKPPVNGRVDEILAAEGERVKAGQTLGRMSSTERAALIDAARGKGEENAEYWKEVYRAIPLISPIDGEVIVAKTQPGQTVTTADAVLVLSDELIVRAQVDETDIGKVKNGQGAVITLDAYPDTKIQASVRHIYYESKTVNNVTIYEVDVLPENIPEYFRSGMNATVDLIEQSKVDALLVPQEAVTKDKSGSYVTVKQAQGKGLVRQPVTIGLTDDKNVEILSGISVNDTLVVKSKKYELPKSGSTGTNPFMPFRRR